MAAPCRIPLADGVGGPAATTIATTALRYRGFARATRSSNGADVESISSRTRPSSARASSVSDGSRSAATAVKSSAPPGGIRGCAEGR